MDKNNKMAKFILDKIHSDDWPEGVIKLHESLQEKSDELEKIAEEHEKAESEEIRKKLKEEYDEKFQQMALELASKHPAAEPAWLKGIELGLKTVESAMGPAVQIVGMFVKPNDKKSESSDKDL